MRKVSLKIGAKFHTGQKKSIGNTMTDGQAVYFHGNKIIERREDGIYFTLAGWPGATTRERINSIAGAGVYQKNYSQMRNGVEISANEWLKV
jgi:hypothetical protein